MLVDGLAVLLPFDAVKLVVTLLFFWGANEQVIRDPGIVVGCDSVLVVLWKAGTRAYVNPR